MEIKLLQAKRVLGNEAKVILNTDSEEYLKKYSSLYDIGILRPKNYGSSEIPMNEVYEYFADSLKNYEFLWRLRSDFFRRLKRIYNPTIRNKQYNG